MRQLVRSIALVSLVALLAGCAGPWAGPAAYPSMTEAVEAAVNKRVSILYVEPFDDKRNLVLFRTDDYGPSPTLLETAGRGRWRMTEIVGLGGTPRRLGALSYDRASLGQVQEKIGDVTITEHATHIVFGQVLDPTISWVELTPDEEGAMPTRADIQNGLWLVRVPPKYERTGFELKAGVGHEVRFVVSVGRGLRGMTLEDAPLVEYRDQQQGIQLKYPSIASASVEAGLLTIRDAGWTVSIEQKPELSGRELEELLQAVLADAENRVLGHGMRPLGEHEAAYLWEARPGERQPGVTYHARYLTVTSGSGYEVTCSMERIYETPVWEQQMKANCDRVLETVRLGGDTEQD